MVGLAEGELGSSSQTHSLASNKSRWDRRVVDSSDVTKEEGTIKQGEMMAAGAQMKETVDKTPSASIGDTEDIFEGTENEGVGVKNCAGKTFFLFFYTSLTNSLFQAWLPGMIPQQDILRTKIMKVLALMLLTQENHH